MAKSCKKPVFAGKKRLFPYKRKNCGAECRAAWFFTLHPLGSRFVLFLLQPRFPVPHHLRKDDLGLGLAELLHPGHKSIQLLGVGKTNFEQHGKAPATW